MNDEKTKRIVAGQSDINRTRLIRREQSDPAVRGETPQEAKGSNSVPTASKTRVIMRPRLSQEEGAPAATSVSDAERPITGWLVVVHGPGRGHFASVFDGVNSVGRDAGQSTSLNFGDEAISREQHAFITYDYKSRQHYIQHGGKAGIVRLNDKPVLQPMELNDRDIVALGETTLRFTAFCGADFDWQD